MNLREYQDKINVILRDYSEKDMVLDGCMGMIAAAGRVVDMARIWKLESGWQPLYRRFFYESCGDILLHCTELALGFNLDLALMYEQAAGNFDVLKRYNEAAALEDTAIRLSIVCSIPAQYIFCSSGGMDEALSDMDHSKAVFQSTVMAHVVGAITMVRDILDFHCGATLEKCMEDNAQRLVSASFFGSRSVKTTEIPKSTLLLYQAIEGG